MPEFNTYNVGIAARLDEVAHILEEQSANPFRVQAYRRAAQNIRESKRPIDEIVEKEGIEGLDKLPGIGESLSRTIFQLVKTGRLPMLDRLRGTVDPIRALASVTGIGRKFAEKLHDELGIESLEELEAAAYDGRLARVAGFGAKRLAGIRDILTTRLGQLRKSVSDFHAAQPTITELLDVDREYRESARDNLLPRIAPRRFNPEHEAWLPVMHTSRQDRHYTVFFSNTANAHRAGKTRDWVLVYCDGGRAERQYTIITAELGPMKGLRLVRGRESECMAFYGLEPGAFGLKQNRRAKVLAKELGNDSKTRA